MMNKSNHRSLVIVEGSPSTATTVSVQGAALDLAVAADPFECLETISRPSYLVLSDYSLSELTAEDGVHLVFEDQKSGG
jgi:hypothetical protein